MTTGLSIDYAIHIIFHYITNVYSDNIQRINASFEACALPMLQVIFFIPEMI